LITCHNLHISLKLPCRRHTSIINRKLVSFRSTFGACIALHTTTASLM
jgi:hypothetical protein